MPFTFETHRARCPDFNGGFQLTSVCYTRRTRKCLCQNGGARNSDAMRILIPPNDGYTCGCYKGWYWAYLDENYGANDKWCHAKAEGTSSKQSKWSHVLITPTGTAAGP
ncbi:hypothetical protein RvY_15083 [Ramazzottius varieornatus]|uniref:Uncharacterized protein n=1 Tax=Ramazzottius varieornatus TaxID=947166 RepID=A0A1D1VTM6_RAMVA|nr:hypothetical protein RvY_15083 [Ramazzottius varieornatus]